MFSPVNEAPLPTNDPVKEPVNGFAKVWNCVDDDIAPGIAAITCAELDTVLAGSNGAICAELDTTPLNLLVIEL